MTIQMAKKDKQPNLAAIQDAAAEAVGEKVEVAPEPAVVEVLPPYLFGEAAPEGVLEMLSQDRIVGIDPAFVSVMRGRNARNFGAKTNIEAVDEMVGSLLANGQENPIKVEVIVPDAVTGEGARIVVVGGETRLRAILKIREDKGAARFPEIKVLLAPEKSEVEREISGATDNSGNRFSMFEMLTVMQRLQTLGMRKVSEVKERLGLSHTAVRNLEILGWATPAIREAVEDGTLTATYVIEKLRETQGEPEKIGLAEKSILKKANALRDAGESSAKGKSTNDEGEVLGREGREKNGLFNRTTYNTLVSVMREILSKLGPDGIDEYLDRAGIDDEGDRAALLDVFQSAICQGIVNVFESAEIPFEDPAVTKAAAEEAAAKEKAQKKAATEAAKAAAEAEKAAEKKAKAEEAVRKLQEKADEARAKAEAVTVPA